jgi:hypothetical protein
VAQNEPIQADALHRALQSLAIRVSEIEHSLCLALFEADKVQLHRRFGMASIYEYSDRFLGLTRRQTEERIRVARALHTLPEMDKSFAEGSLHFSVVRELSRVATADTEQEWLAFAEGKTVRELERQVACRQRGDGPMSAPRKEEPKRVMFEVSGPVWALLQEVREGWIRQHGELPDDDALLEGMAQAWLTDGGTRDDGVAAFQVAVTVCDRCKTATQKAGPDQVVLAPEDLELAECDAQHLGRVDESPTRSSQTVPPRIRRAVERRHHGQCAVPGCRHGSFVHLHHIDRRVDGGSHDPERLTVLCSAHHRAAHGGTLVIRGRYCSGFSFEHADGTPYGSARVSWKAADQFARGFETLVGSGLTEATAHRHLDAYRPHVGGSEPIQSLPP